MPHPDPQWQQFNIQFTGDRADAEHHAQTTLLPVLTDAEDREAITGWFFIRKSWWRIRYLPATDAATDQTAALLHETAAALHTGGHVKQWVHGIYEPETSAFGGTEAMAIAHRLFCADSRYIAAHLSRQDALSDGKRREVSLLLCTALARCAGQDRFERGDIWAKVAQLRTISITAGPAEWTAFKTAITRLIAVDTSQGTTLRTGDLHGLDPWLTDFETTGRSLRALAEQGRLTRGIRAVLAHQIIFHWNRMGIPGRTQAHLAHAAAEAIFE